MGDRMRFRYRRERADGKTNETTSLNGFVKWLKPDELAEGDRFYVADCRWVECSQEGEIEWTTRSGTVTLPHVAKVAEASAKENGPK